VPELPDVERYRLLLEKGGTHRRIAKVSVIDARILDSITPKKFGTTLAGAALLETRRRGKHLLARHDKGGWITMHFGMSGTLALAAAGEEPPPYTRIRFDFESGGLLAYISRRMLGRVGLTDDAEAFCRDNDLGIDALDPALDQRAFIALVTDARRGAKAALMDQSLISGIGNIYSDEVLFQARLHPKARLDALDDAALARLYSAMRRVLEVATSRGAASEEFLDRLPRGYLLPHRKKGGKCPRCGTTLAALKLNARTSWFSPRCPSTP
jgi:formamidopyrimidine-DNA glycosylase